VKKVFKKKAKKVLLDFFSYIRKSRFFIPALVVSLIIWFFGYVIFALESRHGNDQFSNIFDGIWYSVVTLSSTGYGEKVAASFVGKLFTFIIIFFGIGFISYLSGVFASLFVDRNSKARRGLMDFPNIKNHIVICGWTDRMKEILEYMLQESPELNAREIILLNNAEPEILEVLRENKKLTEVKFVRGDFFSPEHLNRASIKTAKKVVVLADKLEDSSISEIDSKTIMTVMTIKSMARDTYVCAELLDKKYESNLRQASCDEILLSREMSKNILASTTISQGMAHIVYELVRGSGSLLKTMEIPASFFNKKYREFLDTMLKDGVVILGVLEHAVPVNIMKMDALREAQKTTDISKLVQNLKDVKEMSVNNPIFAPSDDYIIKKHSMAIILERATQNGEQ